MLDNQGYTRARPCSHTYARTHRQICNTYLFERSKWFRKCASILRYAYIACVVVVLTTHKTNNHAPGGILLFSLCIYSFFCVLITLAFDFFSYSTTHTTKTFMSPARFEPAIPASERPQAYALNTRPLGSATDSNTLLIASDFSTWFTVRTRNPLKGEMVRLPWRETSIDCIKLKCMSNFDKLSSEDRQQPAYETLHVVGISTWSDTNWQWNSISRIPTKPSRINNTSFCKDSK